MLINMLSGRRGVRARADKKGHKSFPSCLQVNLFQDKKPEVTLNGTFMSVLPLST